MKKLVLLFIFTFLTSYSQDSKLFEKKPKDYKLIEMNVTEINNTNFNQKINFYYGQNGKISKIVNISKDFNYEEIFEYKEEQLTKIKYINNNPSLNVIKTFDYNDENKLILIIIERMSQNKDNFINTFVKSGVIEIKYEKNKIEKLSKDIAERFPPEKTTILTDQNGNFMSVTSGNQRIAKTTYDDKNNPNDLIYDKSLMGYMFYGSGNDLTIGENIKYEYKYNNYGFPIEQKILYSGKLKTITTYIYNF